LKARIEVLARQGVDTSNDEELARALQEMLDREYQEELSLSLCRVRVGEGWEVRGFGVRGSGSGFGFDVRGWGSGSAGCV